MSVVVISTGVANTASVLAGLERAGVAARVIDTDSDPESVRASVRTAERLVLPGVGSFASGMAILGRLGLVDLLRERVRVGRPTLAICLGLQLLFESSDEAPGVEGIGAFVGAITRFDADVRVPQMGWNQVSAEAGCALLESAEMYFANSYRLATPPPGCAVATGVHGAPFIAALERGSVLACQFHPELSGARGTALLTRWVEASC